MSIREAKETDYGAIIELWDASDLLRPWNDPKADLERAKAALAKAQQVAADDQDASALKRAETRITVAGAAKTLS